VVRFDQGKTPWPIRKFVLGFIRHVINKGNRIIQELFEKPVKTGEK